DAGPHVLQSGAALGLLGAHRVEARSAPKRRAEGRHRQPALLEHPGDCKRLIADAGVDAGVMIDTFHVLHRHDELGDAVAESGDALEYVHVSDEGRDAPGTHRHFGSFVAALKEAGYDGWLSMEVGFNRREVDPVTLVRASAAHMREIM
ncbi:MAG: hypothetical protein QOD13_2681, partial [Thermoleophilaceae bacterium]|nr:hypothetical protein [Thermoleophilaceae bacterium]